MNESLSPWIISEVSLSKLIRKTPPEWHADFVIMKGEEGGTLLEHKKLKISYPLGTDHLTPLSWPAIRKWSREYFMAEQEGHPLDHLYEMIGLIDLIKLK
jgi:hypothetical protein